MLLNLFRLDFRDILTSDTSPDMATEAFTTETWFISKNNLEIDSSTYINE